MTTQNQPTLRALAAALESGATTARTLVEDCLARIDDKTGEGARTFISVAHDKARLAADGIDRLRKAGAALSPFAGIPVSIKDLFDIAGEVTRAGSRVLDGAAPATRDAAAVARLRQAGFIVIGRTNMSEFAYSGVGLNPHYGTPRSVWDRAHGRIPGGSSSGAAISVTDGMAHAALGTDTGGSCRIPAAFNGLVGYKPTALRVSRAGALPLSTTLDSIGPIARTVECCALVDACLAGESEDRAPPVAAGDLRLAVPVCYLLDGLDADVARAFSNALSRLSAAGVRIVEVPFPEFDEIPELNAKGGFSPPEALEWHQDLIARAGECYDPRVLVRIKRGLEQSALDYIRLRRLRADLIARVNARLAAYDAVAFPTVPIVPPPIEALALDADYTRINMLCLRNPSVINVIDGCAISLPVTVPGSAPVGLTLARGAMGDRALFARARAVEAVLQGAGNAG